MPGIVELKEEKELDVLLESSKTKGVILVLSFWADWHPPCKQMASVLKELAGDHPSLTFVQIEAEKFQEVCENYPVESVPTFVVIKGGEVAETLQGANAPSLVSLASKYSKLARIQAPLESTADDTEALNARLKKLTTAAPFMIFMKGEPENPRCKFSREAVAILKEDNVRYGYFDILTDNEVREGLKTYSNWKTYPQFYINGELIGGLDVVKELREEGEFAAMLPKEARKEDLHKKLKELINQQRVMLFMKGSPDSPQCGFSRKMIEILRENDFEFGYFDILLDQDVREGLKTYSNWKTYPQLYVEGELIGGLDVCIEMAEDGELQELAIAKA